jgi:hypothetical protein
MFVTNGQLTQAQAALAGIGYNPAGLTDGETLLQNWLAVQARTKTLLADQKRATQAEQDARQAAQDEINQLKNTIHILFGKDEPLLTSLGLRPRRTGTSSNGSGSSSSDGSDEASSATTTTRIRPSRSTADTIARWRLLVTNVQALNDEQKSRLAERGWDADRLAATAALVEAYVAAEMNQQQQIQAYQAEVTAAKEIELALRQWYHQAARLTKVALRQTSLATRDQLRDLLGL